MAREWILRGVDEEELMRDKKLEPPKTPRGKWDNYWYHYKWHTIALLAAVVVLAVMIHSCATRPTPDYRIVLAMQGMAPEKAVSKLQETLSAHGEDLDGDGEVEVQVEALHLSGDPNMVMASQTKLMAHLSTGDIMFFIFDKESYQANIQALQEEDYRFFASPELDTAGMDNDSLFWNWVDDPLRSHPDMVGMPEDLYFGVRSISGTSDKDSSRKIQEQTMKMFLKFLENRDQADPHQTGE